MRMLFGVVLVIGLGLASFAVYMAKDYIGAYQAELDAERAARAQIVPTVDVIVATRQLRYGERVKPEDVRVVKWPETALPEGVFTKVDEFFADGEGTPRTALRTMERDEPILAAKVTAPGEDAGISSRLSKGMRAFAIKVDVSTGVSGFLRPGDRVDVYWSGRVPSPNTDEGEREVTKLIQRGMRIVGIDQSADEDHVTATIARTVTVEASPLQVASLAQAQNTGRLALSLLGAEDDTVSDEVAVNQNGLLGIEAAEVVQVEKERVCSIRTRRGGETIEVPIPCTN